MESYLFHLSALQNFSILLANWDAVAIFNQAIWICELSIIAISISIHNIRITDLFSFYKGRWES